ncbi:tyrosine-type recombinase/integrase [Caminibacter sp.]
MKVKLKDCITISTFFNNSVISLYKSCEWTYWLKKLQNLRPNTIRTFVNAMEKFWIWSLYNPTQEKSLAFYLARYRESLLNGFEIKEKIVDFDTNEEYEIPILSVQPLKKVTINKELAGIKSYFFFMEESYKLQNENVINKFYENVVRKSGSLDGIDIHKSGIYLEHFGKKRDLVKDYKIINARHEIKYFPLEYFDLLLELAKPRERLIYLLCGACGARIGQALNLTIYDIDYDNQEVWLISPLSEEKDLRGLPRKQWLLEEYGIDAETTPPHNAPDFQFKYPIPLRYEPLYWINEEKYKTIFFNTLIEYMNSKDFVPEHLRIPRHPFLFVRSTGKRVHQKEIYNRFKSLLKKLVYEYKADKKILELGLHSLRHMFGHFWAELYAKTGDERIIYTTREAMGHSDISSTLIYFDMSTETKKKLLQEISKSIFKEE